MKHKTYNKEVSSFRFQVSGSGFTLIETLIAITVLISAMLGPFTLASQSIAAASRIKNQTTATFLAEEAMEYIRNKRDNNAFSGNEWLNGLDNCFGTDGCIVDVVQDFIVACSGPCQKIKFDAASGLYSYGAGNDTVFRRAVKISSINDREVKVQTIMSWDERSVTISFTLEENLFDWP